MRFGLHALGIGTGARPEIIRAVSGAAEAAGFATLWAGEHVVMADQPQSRYPYSGDGRIAVPADADWLDPLLALTFAAAVTSRIGLATGILLLPEHNPLIVAKQAASLDLLSGGRFSLGAGIGWSAEEYAALGVPFARRGARLAEYLAAMRQLWRCDVASFEGEFVRFREVADANGPALVREQAMFAPLGPGAQIRYANPVVLVAAPFRVMFSYAGSDGSWQPTWQKAVMLPAKIKVTVRDGVTQQQLAISTAALVHIDIPVDCVKAKSVTQCLQQLAQAAQTGAANQTPAASAPQ